MTALHFLGWWLLAGFALACLWAAYRAAVGDIESGAGVEPPCPRCLAKDEHIRLLERANAGLAAKVDDMLVRRRRGMAS